MSYFIISPRVVLKRGGWPLQGHRYLFPPRNVFLAGDWFHYIRERECTEVDLGSRLPVPKSRFSFHSCTENKLKQ